jgi:hypothetical protein
MLTVVQQLALVMDTIAAYDEEIACLFVTHPDAQLFASLPGAGKRLAGSSVSRMG